MVQPKPALLLQSARGPHRAQEPCQPSCAQLGTVALLDLDRLPAIPAGEDAGRLQLPPHQP